jgi:hypothetical protein
MSTKFNLYADKTTEDSIVLHPVNALAIGIKSARPRMVLHYGMASFPIRVVISEDAGKEKVALSRNIASQLRIPLSSWYEIRHKDDEIHLGPYIGFLLTRSARDFRQNLPHLSEYLKYYRDIGGTIVAFPLEAVNTRDHTVEGVVFNPRTGKWDKGTFGYPSSIFIKSRMIPGEWLKHFELIMGKRIFNNFNFDKWEMYQLLHSLEIEEHLPPSIRYKKSGDIRSFLERYSRIYVKPIHGSRGKSVARIADTKKGFLLSYREKNTNRSLFFARFSQLREWLKTTLTPESFIVQKAVDLISYNKRIIDFRFIMVKNEKREWEDAGLFARYGPRESVVSNISAGGRAGLGWKTLKEMFHLSNEELDQWKERVTTLAYRVAQRIDDSGVNCGNMAVDIGIDTQGKMWILEIQHNHPDPTLTLDAGDYGAFSKILLHHLLYLKGLAGFGGKTAKKRRDVL